MKRLIKIILKNIMYVPKYFCRLFRYAGNDEVDYVRKYQLIRNIAERAILKGDITIKTFGTENIPKEDGFIFYLS